MKEIRLTRSFLSKPINSVFILLVLILLIEAISWSIGYKIKLAKANEVGGLSYYMLAIFGRLFVPELFTLFITITLLNKSHSIFGISSIKNDWRSIGRYEIRFLPILLSAFLVFNPITQTVRYFFEQFPNYSFTNYWQYYIANTFTLSVYFTYLFPVIFIGYAALNISLLSDYMKQRREEQEAAEAEAAVASQKALALSETFTPKPTIPSPYLAHMRGKNAVGELDFPVNDAYYFTVEERLYYAEMTKGRYMVSKTLNELEAELDPSQFFRIKRDYIVNRQAVLNYAYWENGKYIVRLNTPDRYEIVVPRARMQEFREWLQINQRSYADSDPNPLAVASQD